MARLICIKGQHEGQHFPIDRGLTIGRAAHNSIELDKTRGVSRDHCKVWKLGHKQFACADVGSTNGTLVNDGKTDREDLNDGDAIQVGEAIFRFEFDEVENPPPAPGAAGTANAETSERERLAAMLRGESAAPSADTAIPGGIPTIEVKQRILQYSKKDNKGTQMGWDMSQVGGSQKLIMWIVGAGIFGGLFFVMMKVMQK